MTRTAITGLCLVPAAIVGVMIYLLGLPFSSSLAITVFASAAILMKRGQAARKQAHG